MTQEDRDNFFSLMVFYDKLTRWQENTESEINAKDRTKLKIISDMIIALLVQYKKREGDAALNAIMEESGKYNFVIIKKDEEMELSGTYEPDILKNAIKNILKDNIECTFCEKKDYKKCDLFTLHNFMQSPKCNGCKNKCPYNFGADFNLD